MPDPSTWVGPLPSYDVTQLAEQRVVCAAQRNEKTGVVIASARHFDSVMHRLVEQIDPTNEQQWPRSTSGFIDQFGTFLTRREAWIVAERQGQIRRRVGGDDDGVLYSENLY